jgi:hypothetical protein
MVLSPGGAPDAALAVAGCRAGALGVLNLEFVPESERVLGELGRLSRSTRTRWGVLLREAELLAGILAARFEGLETILISSQAGGTLGDLVERAHAAGLTASACWTPPRRCGRQGGSACTRQRRPTWQVPPASC